MSNKCSNKRLRIWTLKWFVVNIIAMYFFLFIELTSSTNIMKIITVQSNTAFVKENWKLSSILIIIFLFFRYASGIENIPLFNLFSLNQV
jgi:hypothetical protein